MRRPRAWGALLAIALAAAPAYLGNYWLFVLSLGIVYALLALSLVVLTGWSGQLNIHVAALGLGWGSYAAFALVSWGVPGVWAIVAAGILTIPFAAAVAAVAVRFRGLELAVATLAIGLIFERLAFRNIGKLLARSAPDVTTPFASSFVPVPRPSVAGISLESDAAFYVFCLVLGAAAFVVVGNLRRGATSRTLLALREREVAAESLGIPVIRYRIGAFVGSIVVAAAAGALLASFKRGIAPDSYNLDLSFNILAATVIGGIRSPAGAVIGGGLAALLPEVTRFGPLQFLGGERLFILFGVGMILVLWRRPEGLAARRRAAASRAAPADRPEPAGASPVIALAGRASQRPGLGRLGRPNILRVQDVTVRFGGVVALDGASIVVPHGEICALIGPNGAGKSTLFNCVGGFVALEGGQVYLDGRDVTELAPHRRAALGLGRTFQNVEVFHRLTVRENLMAAGYLARTAGPIREAFGLPGARRSERVLDEHAREILDTIGMGADADRLPGELPLGALRVLELGMALASNPRMLLLDEPSAGLDARETAELAALIAGIRTARGLSVLLVEHDMGMVSSLAEHVYVLDFGRVIAQGDPDAVRRDPGVLEKYLGEEWSAALAGAGGRARARR